VDNNEQLRTSVNHEGHFNDLNLSVGRGVKLYSLTPLAHVRPLSNTS